jgi:hypothetical protein
VNLPIIVSLVAEEDRYFIHIPLDERWRNLRVAFSGRRHVEIEDGIRFRIHKKCEFQLLDRQLRPLRVVFRGVTPVKSGGIDSDDAVSREECDRDVE